MVSLFFSGKFESVSKHRKNSKVFASTSPLFYAHEFFECEHVVFVLIELAKAGEGDEFIVASTFIDGSKNVEVASFRSPK